MKRWLIEFMLMSIVLVIASALVGCGSQVKGVKSKGESRQVMVAKKRAKTYGYILGFEEGYAEMKIIVGSNPHVEIDLDSGLYRAYPNVRSSVIYFAGVDCTGNAITERFKGQVGSSIIYLTNGNYMQVDSLNDYSDTGFEYNSQLSWTGGCANTNQVFNRIAGLLSESTRPFNFTSIAPLTMEYE